MRAITTKQYFPIFLLLLLSLTGFAAAADIPESPADNECYAGGVLEGKCNEDLDGDGTISPFEVDRAWTCGWYLARFNRGVMAREAMPDWCRAGVSSATVSVPACLVFTTPLPGITYCMTGNMLGEDTGNNGTFEQYWYIMSDNVVGSSGLCPAGTNYSLDIISSISVSDYYAWLLSHGFNPYSDYCRLL